MCLSAIWQTSNDSLKLKILLFSDLDPSLLSVLYTYKDSTVCLIRLSLSAEYVSHSAVFFSHNKSANSIFAMYRNDGLHR